MIFDRWMKMFILSSDVSHQTTWRDQMWRHLSHFVLVTSKQSLQEVMTVSLLLVIFGSVLISSTVQRTHTGDPLWGSKWISTCCIGVKKARTYFLLYMHNIWTMLFGGQSFRNSSMNILMLNNEDILFLASSSYSRKITE